ncbi:MAG: ABC transporter permease [Coriobacteriia bacterium]|nr:ABC transporter permease [Coriobacteriia bacterium]
MLQYWTDYHDKILTCFGQHLLITVLALVASVVLATLLTLVLLPHRRASQVVVNLLGAFYAIPSLALFALMIPLLGIGPIPALIVLVLYNQFLLVRNFIDGFSQVDPALTEAATGLGMTPLQILWRVKFPLAFPVLASGLRLAMISTIGIATIAAVVGAGGVGTILFEGLQSQDPVKLIWGTLLVGGLAIAVNAALNAVERASKSRLHYEEAE